MAHYGRWCQHGAHVAPPGAVDDASEIAVYTFVMKPARKATFHTTLHIPWNDLRIFLAVAESGSLSAASTRLRITQPTVSRRVAALEAELGEQLFVRSVDGVAITSYAERLLEPARRMAEWASEVDRAAERRDATPSGLVRVTAAPGVAWDLLVPFAAALRERHPALRIELLSSVESLDLSRREADVALRLGPPTQRDVVSMVAVEVEVAPFAAAVYAKTLPKGYGFADVAWIGWAPPYEHLSPNPELARRVPGWTPAFATDDYLLMLRAAELGLGAMVLGRFRHRFAERSLVELALDMRGATRTLHLLCATGALAIPRVRVVVDALASELAKVERPARRAGR
jgi:DNA-binding transcriptional LysR family regulator